MRERCEVCESFRAEGGLVPGQQLVEVPFDVRPVTLCTGHARIAQKAGVESFAALRALYGSGRRSFVPRRGPNDGTPAAERRRSIGRRASDSQG